MDDAIPPEAPQLGAYGLRIVGADGARQLLVAAEPDWPVVRLSTLVTTIEDEPEEVTSDRARLRLKTGGRILVDRVAGTARYDVRRELTAEELVHPYLAPTAAVMAHWLGRESFHAGAVAFGADAWAVVGDRLAGKSTLLAALAAAGLGIVTDDLLVFDGSTRTVFAGPRSIDLRAEAADRLALGDEVGVAGTRERWRVRVSGGGVPATLRGWIFLAWSDDLALVSVPAHDRIERLARSRAVNLPPRSPLSLLDAASLPCIELRRPRDWDALPDVVSTLVEWLTR